MQKRRGIKRFGSFLSVPTVGNILAIINVDAENISQGTPLVVGKKYRVETLQAGDNFSNVGYVSEGVDFIATGTTPTVWTNNSDVVLQNEIITGSYNDIDSGNLSVSRDGNLVEIKITNGGFVSGKTFPYISGASQLDVVDSNTIRFNNQINCKYIKVEVIP